MQLVKYQVRYDLTDFTSPSPDGSSTRTMHASEFFIGLTAVAGWKKAQVWKNTFHLNSDSLFDFGLEVSNLRIVRITEEVVEC